MNTKDWIWTDELVFEFTNFYEEYSKSNNIVWTSVAVEDFKKSKQQSNVDYEILSFSDKHGCVDHVKGDHNEYFYQDNNHPSYHLDVLLANKYPIKLVRRLSDNEVFTVGSKIQTGNGELSEIKSFKILKTTMSVEIESGYYRLLSKIDNPTSKKPLFTTEDGKEIFDGENYWWVGDNFKIYSNEASTYNNAGRSIDSKYFSTEGAAIEYIRRKKPCLSYEDIGSISKPVNTPVDNFKVYDDYALVRLVKRKIDDKHN